MFVCLFVCLAGDAAREVSQRLLNRPQPPSCASALMLFVLSPLSLSSVSFVSLLSPLSLCCLLCRFAVSFVSLLSPLSLFCLLCLSAIVLDRDMLLSPRQQQIYIIYNL